MGERELNINPDLHKREKLLREINGLQDQLNALSNESHELNVLAEEAKDWDEKAALSRKSVEILKKDGEVRQLIKQKFAEFQQLGN